LHLEKYSINLSWSLSYGSWIYDYLCNQCLSPLKLWVRIRLMAGVPSGTPHAFPQVKKQVHLGKGTRSSGWAGVLDIQHYVIKFVSNLWQFGGFFQILCFPPSIKLKATIYIVAKILLKVVLYTINLTALFAINT
jgi:hypothetical protein